MTPTEKFHRYLHEHCGGKVRLDLDLLLTGFQTVQPELGATPFGRPKLREFLDRLHLEERIDLPKGREHWDTSALPALPRWIKLPREDISLADQIDIRSVPWAPELRFLASARVGVAGVDLLKIQEFFAHGGRTKPLVPIKERSLDIFGDEKRLDQLYRNSALFGDGRLTLKNLGCFVVSEPLPWTPGPATEGPLLVVENAATWHTFCRWNAECKIFSAIIYGCGNRFMDGTDSLREILRTLGGSRRVFYFGDLDPQGLHIPQEASFRAQSDAADLPPIEPHLWSYRQLLALGSSHPQPSDCEPPPTNLADWLGELAEPTRQLFAARLRLAQERLGWEFLQGQNAVFD
jgi:hypothetical protein